MSVITILLWLLLFAAITIPSLGRWLFAWILRAQMEMDKFEEENGLKTWWRPNLLH